MTARWICCKLGAREHYSTPWASGRSLRTDYRSMGAAAQCLSVSPGADRAVGSILSLLVRECGHRTRICYVRTDCTGKAYLGLIVYYCS